MKRWGQNQEGAASFIVVIFLAIILSVLTIGFVRLAVNERRDSTDDDLTKRAFYAAESGTEDAKRAIQEYLDGTLTQAELRGDECLPPDSPNYTTTLNQGEAGYDVEYTCQKVDLTPPNYTGEMDGANKVVTIPLKPVNSAGAAVPLTEVIIRWHMNETAQNDGDGRVGTDTQLATPANNRVLYNMNNWNTTRRYPAMLRANFFSHGTGSLSSAQLSNPNSQHVSFLYPNQSGSSPAANVGSVGGSILNANCSPATPLGSYTCEESFTGFVPGQSYYLRLSTAYRGTHFEVIMRSGATNAQFKDAQAVIDVTGRAADVYRRVRTTVNLNDFGILPSEAITSIDAICKNFSITDQASEFSGDPVTGSSCEP